jgi:poly-gamma-glutamate capsule biosynthesis protein CapA/YwtB (metallophosphatase superfamily)
MRVISRIILVGIFSCLVFFIATAQKPDTLHIIGVGDIMLGTSYPSVKYLPPKDDCRPLLYEVKNILQDADVTFGNLEGCFLNNGPTTKKCEDSLKCYAFRMPDKYAQCLKEAGFNVLSLANNHSGDFGQKGRTNTMRLLDSLKIEYGGLLSKPTASFEIDSIKYGFIAFAPIRGTLDLLKLEIAQKMVRELDEKNDIVLVSFHGGAEGRQHENITRKSEKFYGEDRGNVYEFAHQMIDAGADIIFGHGPHVARAFEVYKGRFIAYSLGNFCTYARFNLSGPNGIAPIVKVFVSQDGTFLEGKIYSAHQMGEGGARLDPNKKALRKIKYLSQEDFPENKIQFLDDGRFFLEE